MRVRKKSWAAAELSSNRLIVPEPQAHRGKWNSFFNSQNPIHIELGSGKGNFIAKSAAARGDISFIGIEREPNVLCVAARKAGDTITNLALISGDASELESIFDENEISRIYINFCDPWPKRKWAKRRLTFKSFLQIYSKILTQSGEVHFKTDNKNLFEFSLNEFSDCGWRLKNISLDLHNSSFAENITTEYEDKFSEMGFPIYRFEAFLPN